MSAGFDSIGPYDLRRSDLVVAALLISFRLGRRRSRIFYTILVILAFVMMLLALGLGELTTAFFMAFIPLMIFVGAPLLRPLSGHRGILVHFDAEGVVAENATARTTYKWAAIGVCRKVGSRLFIMVTPNCALVIPDHATTPANIARISDVLLEGRTTLP